MNGRTTKSAATPRTKAARKTPPRCLTIWDGDNYFDATFTDKEAWALKRKLIDVCGYGKRSPDDIRANFAGFDYDIYYPAQDSIWPAFKANGLDYNRDHRRLDDFTLIHLCRELSFDYHGFAANAPKLPVDGFIEYAKRGFPEFKRPRNKIELKIQEHKLEMAWSDWRDSECPRTGCTSGKHWLCTDRFVALDHHAILEQIAAYNETRPRFAPPRLVYSMDSNIAGAAP